jgi:hypothetical protein
MEEEWKPSVSLDIMTASQKAFNDTYADFYRINQGRSPKPNLLTTGWNTVTPQIAEDVLLGKANRKLSVATIAYYARLMMAGAWQKTGQTMIIDKDGVMRDAYHRAWACLLSGHPFVTYVVSGVDSDAGTLLAIDNSRTRTDADGLEFSGLNGLSKMIAAVVKVSVRYDVGFYEPKSKVSINKMSPSEVVAYVMTRPSLHDAVHGVVAEFKGVLASLLPGKTDIACYVGWRILDLYGVDVMEDFYTALSEEEPEGPFVLLRAKLEAEVEHQRKGYRANLDKRDVLAFLIKTFNAWQSGSAMRRLVLGTDETFPQFLAPKTEDGEEMGFGVPEGVATHPVSGQSDPASTYTS